MNTLNPTIMEESAPEKIQQSYVFKQEVFSIMWNSTESLVLAAFGEYHVKLLECLNDKLSGNRIDLVLGTDVPEDEDIVIYTMMLTGLRIIGGKWGGRGVATLRAKDILKIDGDGVHFWVSMGPNKVAAPVRGDSLLVELFDYLTSRAAGEDRLFRTTYAKVLERFYEYEKELNGTETFIPLDIRRLWATSAALAAMGKNWDDSYRFDADAILPKRWNREAVINGVEDL